MTKTIMKYAVFVLVFVICFLFGCGQTNNIPNKIKSTEIIVIATHHFMTDMTDEYTPAHLRSILERVSPDILAVEAPSNVEEPWLTVPLELRHVTIPWAHIHNIKAVPCGYSFPEYDTNLQLMFKTIQKKQDLPKYQKLERTLQLLLRRHHTCNFMNSREYDTIWRNYNNELHKLYGDITPWEEWSYYIVANISNVCSQNKGKRIAVVFGAAHCYFIKDYFANCEGITLIPTEKYFPLTSEEIRKNTYRKDYLIALRPLNFRNYGGIPISRLNTLEKFLKSVKNCAEFQGDYHLFLGKLMLHRLKPQEALVEFEKVSALDPKLISEFDGQSQLREDGLLFVAISKFQMGNYVQAKQDLESIINMTDVATITKQLAQQILNDCPR